MSADELARAGDQGRRDTSGVELRIERGIPTDEELAAIVGVLLTRRGAPVDLVPEASRWAAAARPVARRLGPDSWRTSALPRH